jgi:enoyl-CoA hydratase/carnithine racemase
MLNGALLTITNACLLFCDIYSIAHGNVVGVGTTLLLHADLVFAAQGTTLSTPFRKVGIPPEFGSSLLFPQRLGSSLSSAMLLCGETVPALSWHAVGAITALSKSSDSESVLELALTRARALCADADADEWAAVLSAKAALRGATAVAVDKAIRAEFDAIDKAFADGVPQRLIPARIAELRRGKM